MRFELKEGLRGLSDEQLLDKLREQAAKLGKSTITIAEFNNIGIGHASTYQRRFGSWFTALEQAGLQPSRSKLNIPEEELFENLKEAWLSLGRQPVYTEMKKPLSKFSAGTYEKRYGSWTNALRQFVIWINSDSDVTLDERVNEGIKVSSVADLSTRPHIRRTRREISTRQRFRILMNSGFRCHSCGVSPLDSPGTELHVDHIIPWSKGGETTDDNLICKCQRCNLGKGNAFVD